jgi:hypothetical protein
MNSGPIPKPVTTPPTLLFELVTYGYVPISTAMPLVSMHAHTKVDIEQRAVGALDKNALASQSRTMQIVWCIVHQLQLGQFSFVFAHDDQLVVHVDSLDRVSITIGTMVCNERSVLLLE